MGLLIMEAIGADGERLAMEAARITETAVGWDSDMNTATFDSDSLDDAELEGVVFDALSGLDSAWAEQLRVAE